MFEDALTAVDAGADALGFVFYEKSPRKVSPETVCEIVGKLPSAIERVGVFVDESAERMLGVAQQAGLTAVQAHMGSAEPGRVRDLLLLNENAPTYKLIAAMAASDLAREGLFLPGDCEKVVLCSYAGLCLDHHAGRYGQDIRLEQSAGDDSISRGNPPHHRGRGPHRPECWRSDEDISALGRGCFHRCRKKSGREKSEQGPGVCRRGAPG